jgi:hypothetical protein
MYLSSTCYLTAGNDCTTAGNHLYFRWRRNHCFRRKQHDRGSDHYRGQHEYTRRRHNHECACHCRND